LRLKGYDYSSPGIYFVTICTTDRIEIFGNVENSMPALSDIGYIADDCWKEIPDHFPQASLMECMIMPDHIHGLIRLRRNEIPMEKGRILGKEKGTILGKEKGTIYRASTERNLEAFGKPTKGSIPTIIRTYKAAVTRIVNRKFPILSTFVWQPGYYEHIVRNRTELGYTIDYIKSNPREWEAEQIRLCGQRRKRILP
jgi:REP element-mobilizing transposase RayT